MSAANSTTDVEPVTNLTARQQLLAKRMLSFVPFAFFKLVKLPSLSLWGISIRSLNAESCTLTMPYGWRTQNPFNSVYFAAQSGAAELSTGALALLHLEGKGRISMLVTQFDSKYYKKASDNLTFVCESGREIATAIEQSIASGEGKTVVAHAKAYLPDQVLASEFWVTWSFRVK